ncbi:gamma-glutamyltransferase [Alkalihalophilus lindianensis]|uniref:Glutathione hydrolase proenzyme n=1 Tax=Alkalihalophilus lindianensis TaxID=1630542 RepID=A0ABU3XAY6_9BACI|nr:gamma-glutamyltransferase [Alkalihalophilus lindianensis]MDV2684468.1 gamma-glutamyltransferase [Alkalihalophilus lindianensis]
MKKSRSLLSMFMVLVLLVTLNPAFGQAKKPTKASDLVAVDKDGMVSTSHPLASQIGVDVLKKGGNAMDAAIAVQFALNVVEPMMSGIGGGGFMMVYEAETGETTIVNSRERAPAGVDPEMFLTDRGSIIPFQERVRHGNSVGVPGTLKGLEKAHELWGTVPFKQLVTPAFQLAQNGFSVDRQLALQIENNKEKLALTAASDVYLPKGEPLVEGDWLIQRDLAKTLRLIRSHGSKVFYNGEIGEALAETVQEFGGSMTIDDLRDYNVTIDEPVWGEYKGYTVASMPPPSSGGVFLLQMLKMLDTFELEQYERRTTEVYHLLAEAMHLAYADRGAYAGDPEFVEVPMVGLLHSDYIAERSSLIDINKVNEDPQPGDPWKYESGSANYEVIEQLDEKDIGETTHFTVADRWGNLVSYTTTIEQVFGSGIMVPGYGLMLNNELTDFDARPGGANEVQPNKRPLSSMTPTIVFENGKPLMSVGSPGGPTIITSVLQVILNVINYEMGLEEAIKEPRIYTNNLTSYRFEEGIPIEVLDSLKTMGHKFGSNAELIGNVQSIYFDYDNDEFHGVADARRDGASIGFTHKGKGRGH